MAKNFDSPIIIQKIKKAKKAHPSLHGSKRQKKK
jgi:hypothetical protein